MERMPPGGRHGPVFRAGRYSGHLPADGGASGAYRAVDTEVDSIRTFDLESRVPLSSWDEIDIYPATEIVLTKKQAKGGRGVDPQRGEELCGEAEITAEHRGSHPASSGFVKRN